MISFFRRIITSRWGAVVAILFVGLMGLSLVLSDATGSSAFGGLGQGNIAQVGDRKITVSELEESINNRLKAERQQNPTLDMGRFVESGGLDATLEQLINRYALAVFAEKHGALVSDKLVNQEILKLPGAAGLDGKFDKDAYARFLAELNLTDQMIRDDFRQNFYARKLLSTAGPGAKAASSMAIPYASLDLEKRSGEVAVISANAYMPKEPPSEAVLAAYYKANATRYTIPEKRAINYAIFDASIVDEKAKPSETEIADYYKKNAAKYSASEVRDLAQLVFPTQAAAQAAADKIKGGQSIDAVAKQLGLSVVRSSGITREALTKEASKAVADAVFGAGQGSLTQPAKGSLGFYVISVNAVKSIAARPLAAASSEIAAELQAAKREELLGDLTSNIENEFDDGSTIADVAKTQGLTVETTPKLLANGRNPENPGYKPIAEMARIIPAAFELDTDGSAQLIPIEDGKRFAMVSVADVDPAAPAPLAEIRNEVSVQWALAEGNKKAKAIAEQVKKAVAAGQSLSAALAASGAQGAKIENLAISRGELNKLGTQGQQVPPPLALMFSMKKGTAKALQAPADRGWFVVRLNEVIRGDASKDTERVEANRAELQTLLSQEYAAQLILAARKEAGVETNKAAVKALRDQLTNKNKGQ
jgi:peptidyl-prolyl cis-trans isomerase D